MRCSSASVSYTHEMLVGSHSPPPPLAHCHCPTSSRTTREAVNKKNGKFGNFAQNLINWPSQDAKGPYKGSEWNQFSIFLTFSIGNVKIISKIF